MVRTLAKALGASETQQYDPLKVLTSYQWDEGSVNFEEYEDDISAGLLIAIEA